jgi:DNA-binding SARP family transcriptional activator
VLHVNLLDGFYLEVEGREVALTLGIQRLVANVALRGRPSRLSVAGQLWPEVSDGRAQGNLRAGLHRLQASCPGLICGAGGALRLGDQVRVDVRDVTRWALGVLSQGANVNDLQAPDGVYAGEILPGWYEDWVALEREQFMQLRLHALEALSDRLTQAGRFGEALYAGYSAVRAEPLRESAHRAIIRVHLAEGNIAEAIGHYKGYRRLLLAEVGVEPTTLIRDLLKEIPGNRSATQ